MKMYIFEMLKNVWSTLAGLEPAISGVGNRRLIHLATGPLLSPNQAGSLSTTKISTLGYSAFWDLVCQNLHSKSGVLPVIWERVRNHLSHLILFFFRGNTITVNVVDRSRNWTLMMGCGDWCVHYSKIERCGACTKGWFDLGGPAWRKLTGGELPGHIRGVKSK